MSKKFKKKDLCLETVKSMIEDALKNQNDRIRLLERDLSIAEYVKRSRELATREEEILKRLENLEKLMPCALNGHTWEYKTNKDWATRFCSTCGIECSVLNKKKVSIAVSIFKKLFNGL